MLDDAQLARFNILRNALYHGARRRTFMARSRLANLAIILLGAAAIGDVTAAFGIDQLWIGAAVAIIGALNLVFDWGGMANTHTSLQKAYFNLLADTSEVLEPSAREIASWNAKMFRITADEPPTYRALDAKAYNDALDAQELGNEHRLHIPKWQLWLGRVFYFEGTQFRKLSELPSKS